MHEDSDWRGPAVTYILVEEGGTRCAHPESCGHAEADVATGLCFNAVIEQYMRIVEASFRPIGGRRDKWHWGADALGREDLLLG